MIEERDAVWMEKALCLARRAAEEGEVPVGAVVVKDGEIIGEGYNRCETEGCAMAHAEMIALHRASERLGTWRLDCCELYVTMEPCPMCAGAIVHSRLRRVVYGAPDERAGAFGSVLQLNAYPFHRAVLLDGGLLADESRSLLQGFFAERRHTT